MTALTSEQKAAPDMYQELNETASVIDGLLDDISHDSFDISDWIGDLESSLKSIRAVKAKARGEV
jgi:t-SNARE complex subunit (syntaxin)